MNDLRFAFRMLVRNPAVAAIAVLSLALGITLNSAIFSVVDALWLRAMPFAEPARVVRIFGSTPKYQYEGLSYPDYLDLQAQMHSLSGLAAVARHGAIIMGEDGPEDLRADVVSRNFFSVLGIKPYLGQFFSAADDPALRNTPTVVLSHRLWQRRFGGDAKLVGKTITLTGRSVVVIGIAPPGFNSLERMNPAQVWYPEEMWGSDRTSRRYRDLDVVGRLKPGYTVAQAQAEAETIFRRLDLRDAASQTALKALVLPEQQLQFRRTGRLGLLLLGVVGTVLLLACTNVSGLLLARAEVRAHEMAVRAALGGTQRQLISQLMTESCLLALLAAALSLLLAQWVIAALPALLPPEAGALGLLVRLDGRVVRFTAAISLLTVFLFGLAPAVHASRPGLLPLLRGGPPLGRLPGRRSSLDALVVGQMSAALALLSVVALLTRSLLAAYTADLGFERKDILLVQLYVSGDPVEGRLFYRQLKERVLAMPGAKRVSLARVVPFSPSGTGASQTVFVPGGDAVAAQQGRAIRFNAIDADYFPLLGQRLLRGRGFTESDGPSSPQVMVINETMARSFWPDQDPIGQSVRLGSATGKLAQIIGVVQDAKCDSVGEAPEPYLYLALAQQYHWEAILLVESVVPPATMAGPVRAELRALGVTPSRTDVSTLKHYIHAEFSAHELFTKVFSFLGLLGLGLAAVGLYGVLAYAVNRRTQEIGIRLALGAQRWQVLTLVLKRGLVLALLGVGLGLPMALAVGWAVRGFLYGVKPVDPVSLAVSVLLLLSVAALATYFPARRATRVDPLVALRYE